MLPLGLSTQEQRWFHEALVSSQRTHTRLQLLDLDHNHLGDLTELLDDGQVDIVSIGEKATRSCSLTLFDPWHRSTLDGATPGTTGVYLDRMIRVIRSTWVPQMGEWVDVPMFTGPITKAPRSGHSLNVEAMGKEILAQSPRLKARVWAKGLTRVGVCRSILEELAGETRFDLPSLGPKSARLPKNLTLPEESIPWDHVMRLSRSMNWQGFYDGRGVFRMRAKYSRPVWEFRDGDGGAVLSMPQVEPDIADEEVFNRWRVKGNGKIDITRTIPTWHSRSPQSLGRRDRSGNLVPRYLLHVEENDDIRTRAEAVDLAEEMRREGMKDTGKVTWEGLVIPHLEPVDTLQIDAGGIVTTARLREASWSLRAATATYGYTKVLRRNRGMWRLRT